jgi:Mn2+/Fe2+ NRAMP family transporter
VASWPNIATVRGRRRALRDRGFWRALRSLGPGLVSGASDNDPTTVATVAVVGSTTVYALGWVCLLIFPMLAVVQAIAARVGQGTRRDLGDLVRTRYGTRACAVLVVSVVAVALFTLAADLKAGAAALGLLLGIDLRWLIPPLAAAVLAILCLGSYRRIRQFLQVVALAFLAYVVSAFAAHPHWGAVLHGSFIPSWRWNSNYTGGALALLGTTLTSYVYVWETIELAEEAPSETLSDAELDAVFGALFVVAVFWFILIATGATLGVHHHQVQTAEDAARALQPIAGSAATTIFGIGLLASALLAVPVLMATIGYLVGTQRGWPGRLSASPRQARAFYATMAVALVIAAAISYVGVSAIHLLFLASIAGAVGTPVSLVFLLLVARDRETMGRSRVSRGLAAAGYLVAALVSAFGVAALLTG